MNDVYLEIIVPKLNTSLKDFGKPYSDYIVYIELVNNEILFFVKNELSGDILDVTFDNIHLTKLFDMQIRKNRLQDTTIMIATEEIASIINKSKTKRKQTQKRRFDKIRKLVNKELHKSGFPYNRYSMRNVCKDDFFKDMIKYTLCNRYISGSSWENLYPDKVYAHILPEKEINEPLFLLFMDTLKHYIDFLEKYNYFPNRK